MKRLVFFLGLLLPAAAFAQATPAPDSERWASVAFLEGTWTAKVSGSHSVSAAGTYVFQTELDGHIFARHSSQATGCTGPTTYDCDHGDLLYLYRDGPGRPLRAIYFDNEGHVIHYLVSTPDAMTAVFLSDDGPGPRFRLTYRLSGGIMSGRFESRSPGSEMWNSYLEWSGPRVSPGSTLR